MKSNRIVTVGAFEICTGQDAKLGDPEMPLKLIYSVAWIAGENAAVRLLLVAINIFLVRVGFQWIAYFNDRGIGQGQEHVR